ncbi:MAG: hypothetical protein H0T60_10385 [Acidobacteria bacterium]|nr:hypothetical protein [Acidobacteriota bacterium]
MKRALPMRWRKYNDTPEMYELRRGGYSIAMCKKTSDGKWIVYNGSDGVPFNTANNPVSEKVAAQSIALELVKAVAPRPPVRR